MSIYFIAFAYRADTLGEKAAFHRPDIPGRCAINSSSWAANLTDASLRKQRSYRVLVRTNVSRGDAFSFALLLAQVLDATVNRLRELANDSLSPYKNLAFIYLADNFIQNIEEAAFANQHYLQVLDLKKNGCDNLPKSLFQLPHLTTLYLDHNKLTDSVFKVPVSSPLNVLELPKNKLTRIPDIDVQPTLTRLNVSDNAIVSISSEDLAPFCMLKVLDLSRNPIRFKDCECQTFKAWLDLQHIEVKPSPFNCNDWPTEKAGQCANAQISNRTQYLYEKCSAVIKHKVETEKARSVWIMVVSCVSVFLVCLFVALYCVHKKNRRRRRKQKEQQQQLAANNANTELLNSNLTSGNS